MNPTKDNFEIYKQSKDELYAFLNKQSKGHPKDWDLIDHLILVLDLVLTQYVLLGLTDKQIWHEIKKICNIVRKRDRRKLN